MPSQRLVHGAAAQALEAAVRRLLRPFVRTLVDAGLTFPAVADLLRETYVDVALRDLKIDGETSSVSRVSMLTGIHRREVTRLAKQDRVHDAIPKPVSLGIRVIQKWCGDEPFIDQQKRPKFLPRSAPKGQPSFESLVASVSKDIRARVLLDEWLRLGVVVIEDDKIGLRVSALVPKEGFEEKVYYFGRNLRDHIKASAHNLSGEQPIFIDRAVYEDSLSDESVEELRIFCEDRGMDLLIETNQKIRKLVARDRQKGSPERRMTFGVYFFGDTTARNTDHQDNEHRNNDP